MSPPTTKLSCDLEASGCDFLLDKENSFPARDVSTTLAVAKESSSNIDSYRGWCYRKLKHDGSKQRQFGETLAPPEGPPGTGTRSLNTSYS